MKIYPEVEIEFHGHTDGMAGLEKSMSLSQLRAEAVRQYFIAKGITPERVRAIGFGSSSPIADNKTAAGRAKNRRIEMIRIK
jgi:outer membrane protein OmpA-like peptidoglycan-associated protein